MEKKTTQRIIGILVIAALIVILLPLLFDGNNTTAQTANVKAPPFPNQQNASTEKTSAPEPAATPQSNVMISPDMANSINNSAPAPTTISSATEQPSVGVPNTQNPQPDLPTTPVEKQDTKTTVPPEQTTQNNIVTIVPAASPSTESNSSPQTPANPTTTVPAAAPAPAPANQAITNPAPTASAAPVLPNEEETTASPVKPEKPIKKVAAIKTKHIKITKHAHAKNSDLVQLKNAAWVVQMGSFKVKSNALRLTNQLRAQGFKAFTREFKSSHGESMRVYVGPEFQQAAAESLANKIQQEINMRGIIVSYRPLEI